jgi:hypothetical protein
MEDANARLKWQFDLINSKITYVNHGVFGWPQSPR